MSNTIRTQCVANLKMLFRDRQALFWSLIFPTMFLIIFGLFSFDKPQTFSIAFIDEANTTASADLKERMTSIGVFENSTDVADREDAITQIKAGDLDGLITIPAAFAQLGSPDATEPIPISVAYDESNPQNGVILSVLNQFLGETTLAMSGATRLFSVTQENVQAKGFSYISFLMPGILGMGIMFSSVIGIAVGVTRYRERKILKRLRATPMRVWTFFVAEVGAHLVRSLLQIAVIIAVGLIFFHVQVVGSYVWIVLTVLVGTIIFLNLGFLVAGLSRSVNTAEAMSNVVTMPMMFLSGVFFSPDMLPKVVERVVDFLPLTSLLKILRGIALDGASPLTYGYQWAILAGWILVSFLVATRAFSMERE